MLEELGSAARSPIVPPAFRAAGALATKMAGAAKVSGAGGGDIGVAFFTDPEAADDFRRQAGDIVEVLPVAVDPEGVRLD